MNVNVESLTRSRIPFSDEYYDRLIYVPDAQGCYRLKPNQTLAHITINSEGYRGPLFKGEEPILLLGDSVTFGVGVSSDQNRFSKFWERACGYSIADASIRAYRVDQHYAQLPLLLDLLPRLKKVFVWCGFADLLYWATTGGRIEGSFQLNAKYAEGTGWRRWIISNLTKKPSQPSEGTPKGSLPLLAQHIGRHMAAMQDLCGARQMAFEVLLQPFIRRQPEEPTLRSITDFYDERTKAKCGISWYDASSRFITELTREAEMRKVPMIDLQSLSTENDFWDQVHLNQDAHQRIAEKLSASLRKMPFEPAQTF